MKKLFAQSLLFAITIVSMAQSQNVYEWKNGTITIKNSAEIDSITFSIPNELFGVTTDSILDITATTMTANFSANFSVNSSCNVIAKGVCYSPVNENPTVNDSTQMFGYLSNRTWTSVLTGLKASTTYYFRPFLKANDKIFYGTTKSFTTSATGWKSLGMGKMADAFIYDDVTYFDVEIQQNEVSPNAYRIVNPYDQMLKDGGYIDGGAYMNGPDKYFEFEVMPAGTDYEGTILDRDYVIFNDVNTGYWHPTYEDDVIAIHPYRFGMALDLWNYNVVLDYQENGLPGEVSIAPYYYIFAAGGGWNKTTSTSISVLFPGYVKRDYSVSVNYAGIFTANDGTVHAMADLVLGPDAKEVKAIVMPAGADAAAIADAIAAGELEAIDVEAGRIEVPFNAEELGGNNFQIITVVLFEGAVKSVAATSFEYYGGGNNPWKSLGTGYYTDDIIAPLVKVAPPTYEVEILENENNPGIYRVMNPYSNSVYPLADNDAAPEGLYIEINAQDPEGVYILQQTLGFDWGVGEFGFATVGGDFMSSYDVETVKKAGYLGSVTEGTITFPVLDNQGVNMQGYVYANGELFNYAGMNGKIEIVLPGSNAFARNMAIAKANTTKREMAKKSFSGIKAGQKMQNLKTSRQAMDFVQVVR